MNLNDISIHALLAESDAPPAPQGESSITISIHALLAESDIENTLRQVVDRSISIHALLAESDSIIVLIIGHIYTFLSTLSLRRATVIIHTPWALRTFLSTLSLRRATPRLSRVVPTPIFLSTLSLRRATSCGLASHQIQKHFYPRSPCGERHTKREVAKRTTDNFYPRSPCGERPTGPTPVPIAPYFYPRSPCGERPLSLLRSVIFIALFLSTLSLRRATTETRIFRTGCVFLSTLSLRRAT